MEKWIERVVLVALTLTVASPATPAPIFAQTEKVNVKSTSGGEIIQTPYITYEEFKDASIDVSRKGKRRSSDATGGMIILGDLVSIASLNEIESLFGEPKTLTHDSPYGQNLLAFLSYDGLRLEYIKYDKDEPNSTYKLRTLTLSSPERSLAVNGTKLRPGMSIDQLSPAVRQTLNEDFSQAEEALGSVVVTKPGAATKSDQGEDLEPMRGGATISFSVEDGIVTEVQFGREL